MGKQNTDIQKFIDYVKNIINEIDDIKENVIHIYYCECNYSERWPESLFFSKDGARNKLQEIVANIENETYLATEYELHLTATDGQQLTAHYGVTYTDPEV